MAATPLKTKAPGRERRAPWNYGRILRGTIHTTVVLVFCILAVAPFLVMGITAFQTDRDLYRRDASPFDYAEAPTLEHLDNLFNDTGYLSFIRNSVAVGVVVVLITLVLALPAAYCPGAPHRAVGVNGPASSCSSSTSCHRRCSSSRCSASSSRWI